MSIYFIHLLKEILCISIFGAIFSKNTKLKNILVSFFLGYIFAYLGFFIAKEHLVINQITFFANILILALFFISIVFLFNINFVCLRYIICFLFAFAYFIRYFKLSQGFSVFSTSFLDNEAILSFTFIILAVIFAIVLFFIINFAKKYNEKFTIIFSSLFVFIGVNVVLGDILLHLEKYNLMDRILALVWDNQDFISSVDSKIITYISKVEEFYNTWYIYSLFILILILGLNAFRKKIKNLSKKNLFDIEYRKNISHNELLGKNIATLVFVLAVSSCISLYFDKVESKPMELSPAKTPIEDNGYFVFDVAEFRDNDLHRYAYVSPSGKRIRFFIINRFEDKDSPTVVLDACNICGDMGYVLKDNEVICVACGVRIFRPSIGKKSGCNPVPVENVIIKDEKVYVPVSEIIASENYFSEIVPIEVTDPVDGSKFYNKDAKEEYQYNGLMYYFKNEENLEKFKQDPTRYIKSEVSGKFIIKNQAGSEANNDW